LFLTVYDALDMMRARDPWKVDRLQEKTTKKLNISTLPIRAWKRIVLWAKICVVTLRGPILRFTGHLALLTLIALGVWAARLGWDTLPMDAYAGMAEENESAMLEPPTVLRLGITDLPPYASASTRITSVGRSVDIHTVFPERPRLDLITYLVQEGDSLFGIADKFSLKPETILWGNFDVLQDNPHRLKPGQELNIPPVDGTLYEWHEGDGLNGVAQFFGVEPGEIIQWPTNHIDPDMDPENPDIESGTVLIIPGGRRELVSWSAPRISRSNPAVAKVLGPGACGSIYDGVVGGGTFIYPTPLHYLSGFDYSSIHPAIDLAGSTGHAIFASDSGVVVYAGWNDWGYGYVIVLDHGNGWQTLYAHLSAINVVCGQSVYQGDVIGAMGSTGNSSGPHLHFEIMHDEYGKVNPHNFLQ
jgi:murein DD-endopeptidase MepM/ murein hydrolase activator NlpD